MSIATTYSAKTLKEMLEQNLRGGKEDVDTYQKIYAVVERDKGYYDFLWNMK